MATIPRWAPLAALMVLAVFAPAAAQAQDQRLRISFAPAMAVESGEADLALGGSVGYRFLEHVWFEGELTWIDGGAAGFRGIYNLDPRTVTTIDSIQRQLGVIGRSTFPNVIPVPGGPLIPSPIPIGPIRVTTDGSTLIGTMGVRYELPAQGDRFRPYLAAGLGINRTDQEFRVDRTLFAPAFNESASLSGYAFSAGGGASVRLAGQLWADVDTKYFRLSRDRNIMRLGGGVSYRF